MNLSNFIARTSAKNFMSTLSKGIAVQLKTLWVLLHGFLSKVIQVLENKAPFNFLEIWRLEECWRFKMDSGEKQALHVFILKLLLPLSHSQVSSSRSDWKAEIIFLQGNTSKSYLAHFNSYILKGVSKAPYNILPHPIVVFVPLCEKQLTPAWRGWALLFHPANQDEMNQVRWTHHQ